MQPLGAELPAAVLVEGGLQEAHQLQVAVQFARCVRLKTVILSRAHGTTVCLWWGACRGHTIHNSCRSQYSSQAKVRVGRGTHIIVLAQ